LGFGYHDEEEEDSDEECTEYSRSVASHGTKIQDRHRTYHNHQTNEKSSVENDGFFQNPSEKAIEKEFVQISNQAEPKDDGFDGFFIPETAAAEETSEDFFGFPVQADSNIMDGSNDDPYFEPPSKESAIPLPPKFSRMASAHSLSYSPSPTHNKKKVQSKTGDHTVRDARLPLSPLNNMKRVGGPKGGNKGNQMLSQTRMARPDPDEAWGYSKQSSQMLDTQMDKPDPDTAFDAFGISEKKTSWRSQKRDPSISGGFELSKSDGITSSAWSQNKSFPEENKPTGHDEGSTKENTGFGMKSNAYDNKYESEYKWGNTQSNRTMGSAFSSESDQDDDSCAEEDSFDPVAVWEKPGMKPMGIQNFPNSKRYSGGSVSSYGSRRVIDDDNNASTGGSRRSASGSYTKPLGLPSNAIMASMLFRTHYNIDQQEVEDKLKKKEEEHSKDQKLRKVDIPEAVHADYDHMSHVSSFSEETTNFQDAWRKPSRDLLDYFSKARTMEVDTKKRFDLQRAKAKALFEA
jgi:hypothetical protein